MPESPLPMTNTENTCYMNSVIQLFLICTDFNTALLASSNPKNSVADIYARLYEAYLAKHKLFQNVLRVFKAVYRVSRRQEDAHETITKLLSSLDNQNLFEGKYCITKQCSNCKYIDVKHDHEIFREIILYIPPEENCTLRDMFGHLYKTELLQNVRCDICKKANTTYVSRNISSGPRYILMLFARYQPQKNTKEIGYFPTIKLAQKQYELTGVVNHTGDTAKSGHYYSYVKYPNGWFHCNDMRITPIDYDQIYQKDTYMLLYERQTST